MVWINRYSGGCLCEISTVKPIWHFGHFTSACSYNRNDQIVCDDSGISVAPLNFVTDTE